MTEPLAPLLDWIAVDSTTGREGEYADALADHLRRVGFAVERQAVGPGRDNLLARAGPPAIVFCTHLDTVPPFFGPRADRSVVHGRGACDAKGVAWSMIEAGRRLLDRGEDRVGFLFTVGEEVDFAGARAVREARPAPFAPRFTVVGEPTENRFVKAHKGVLGATLVGHGVKAHSSRPLGPSAIHEVVRAVAALLDADCGAHPVLGEGSLNVGTIRGGLAKNVVADHAEAELFFRTVEPTAELLRRVRDLLREGVDLVEGVACDPCEFLVPPGREGTVETFGTDAPFLDGFGERLLYGPGRIVDAHTDHERIERAAIDRAVAEYVEVAVELLARPEGPREE